MSISLICKCIIRPLWTERTQNKRLQLAEKGSPRQNVEKQHSDAGNLEQSCSTAANSGSQSSWISAAWSDVVALSGHSPPAPSVPETLHPHHWGLPTWSPVWYTAFCALASAGHTCSQLKAKIYLFKKSLLRFFSQKTYSCRSKKVAVHLFRKERNSTLANLHLSKWTDQL